MRLGDVADLVNGYAFDSKHFNVSTEGMPLIRIRDVIRGFTETYTTEPYKEEYVIRKGDLLIGMDGEFNIAPWNSNDALLNQRVCKIASRSSAILNQYLYYFLPKALKSIEDATAFVTVKHLSSKKINDIQIPLPPLPVQQQIANVLDRASALIEKRKAQIEKLDLLVKSQFIEMFGDPVTNPMGWEIGTIRDLVTDVKYGTSKPAEEKGRYVYLRMNNITYGGSIDLSDLKYINVDDKDYEKYIVRKGDVLFNRTNSKELVGKTAVFKGESPMIIAGYIIRVRTNEKAHPEYISAFLNSRYGKSTLLDMCKAIVGQANINAQELQDIKIPLAPISIQNKFADFVHQVESQKSLLQQSLAKLELNYKSLMQKCFRGEVF